MYVIEYTVNGRSYIHVGTQRGIVKLLANELRDVDWRFVGRHKFKVDKNDAATSVQ